MNNVWDLPPWPGIGDADSNTLYAAIGKLLTEWEFVEEALARFFGLFTSTTYQYPKMAPAIRAYGTIISFSNRADMVAAAGETFFHGYTTTGRPCPFESEFAPLIHECKGWSGRRNEVVHGRVWGSPHGYFLFPGLYSTKKQPLGQDPKYCYNSAQITGFGIGFQDLYDRLNELAGRIDNWQWSLIEKLTEQPRSQEDSPPKNN